MVFYWSLSDSESLQVSRTLLSILVDLNDTVVWIASSSSFISNSSSPFINPLVTVPRATITTGVNVTFKFHSFFQFPNKVEVFILLFTIFQFYFVVSRNSKVHNFASSLFFLVGLVVWLRLSDPFVCQNPRRVWVCNSPGQMLGCAYTICS